ncbi:MAG: helix-turn-helix domain-containing protein [Clostridiales bacterium]|nr:helix-turn-helix domain-containing protein [Clostridiales bacterium]
MSVGSKIRYVRNLRNLTQKELGMKVGFSPATADVRIRQYEYEKMVPKADILKRIADALDVDITALNGVDFQSEKELMHTLFDLERNFGLRLEKRGSKYMLCFDQNSEIEPYMDYALSSWYKARETMLNPFEENADGDLEYHLWTQRFPIDLVQEETSRKEQTEQLLVDRCDEIKTQGYKINKVSELILLFEKMIKSGINLEIRSDKKRSGNRIAPSLAFGGRTEPPMKSLYTPFRSALNERPLDVQRRDGAAPVGKIVACVSIRHSQFLSLHEDMDETNEKADDTAAAYAEYLCAIEYLVGMGIEIEQGTHSFEGETYTDYYFRNSMLSTMVLQSVKKMQEKILAGECEDEDYLYEVSEDIRIFNVKIESAVEA